MNNRKNKNRGGNNSVHGGNNSAHSGNNSAYSSNNSAEGGKNKKKGSRRNRQNNQRFVGGERHFKKFVDTEHTNYESNYWPQNSWNCDNSRIKDYQFNEQPPSGGGIYPWIRNKPVNQLIIPRHINFDDQYEKPYLERVTNNVQQIVTESTGMEQEPLREISAPKNDNTEVAKPFAEVQKSSVPPVTPTTTVKIKQEQDVLISLAKEKKASSSSSSSESSSNEDGAENNNKAKVCVKPETTSIAKPPSSPLNIRLKNRTSSVSSTQIKTSEKIKPLPDTSSSSSSSSSDEETPLTEKKEISKTLRKSASTSRKISSEDDVVCVGKLDNKIVLEDESDNSSTEEEPNNEKAANVLNKLSKKSKKQTSEKCMICDKKGHTSFQCQMICKNCSAPYHGYRTCPHPANLNIMMQLFIEFCMQQLQNFQVEKQSTATNCNNVPKPKIDSSHLSSAVNKSSKHKRKQVRISETNKKHKKSKKRKVSASKKTKSKANSAESNDDDESEDESDTETSSTAIDDHISDSSAESLVSSKKKRKKKNQNSAKAALDLSSFSANSVGLPMVLNSFPNLTVPTTSIQNQNTSTNALNTLLLTQMFQNAIGSLKK